jgi:hypothetical protein
MNCTYNDGAATLTLGHSSPSLDVQLHGCKGELMLHQNKICQAVLSFENTANIEIITPSGDRINRKTNRIKINLKMGAGKTKLATSIILANKLPKIKPIYFSVENKVTRSFTFNNDRVIDPTFIVVRHSVFGQWVDQIKEFSNLRVYNASDSRSIVKLTKAIQEELAEFNANYDVVLINYKTIFGNVEYVLQHCQYIHEQNTNKGKRIHTLLFNMLQSFYIRRLIYDDWDMLNMKQCPLENSGSCLYMSATNNTPIEKNYMFNNVNRLGFINSMHALTYNFSTLFMNNMFTIRVDDVFLAESIAMGIGNLNITMMPPKPIVYICNVNNNANNAINIISELSNNETILESVNNLSNISPSNIIKSLFAERLEPYKLSVKIINTYTDVLALSCLPRPPPEMTFTHNDIMMCKPILFSYRDIVNRVTAIVNNAKKIVNNEENMLTRVRSRISENNCPICFDTVNTEPAAIMLCCNSIIHVSCAMKCRSANCPLCRVPYGRTFLETFVCLHHDINMESMLEAMSTDKIMNISNTSDNVTKFSILHNIIKCEYDNINMSQVNLKKFESIIFDENSTAVTVTDKKKIKVLVYCSSNETLISIEKQLTGVIKFSRLTHSSACTYKKIFAFESATEPAAILANSWGDAAGIDFKMATDVVILNYIDSPYIMQQIFGRVLRIGQIHRPRIFLVSYGNEATRWKNNYINEGPPCSN